MSTLGDNALALTLFGPDGKGGVSEDGLLIGPRRTREEFLANFDIELADGRIIEQGGLIGVPTPDLESHMLVGDRVSRITHWDAMPPQPSQHQQAA